MNAIYVLTNGLSTPFVDCRPYVGGAMQFQVVVTGTVTWTVEGSNDNRPTSTATNVDLATYAGPFSGTAAKVIRAPFPVKLRIKQTSGSGSVVVSFGYAHDGNGNGGQVGPMPVLGPYDPNSGIPQ